MSGRWQELGPTAVEAAAIELFGRQNSRLSTRRDLRFGKNGSVSVCLIGEDTGCFYDFEAQRGGVLRMPHNPVLDTGAPTRGSPTSFTDQERIRKAIAIWRQSGPLKGSIADRYLRNVRGLDPEDAADLRCHDALYLEGYGPVPALVALMRCVHSGEPQAVHRTFLTHDSAKIERRVLGPTKSTAIMLDGHDAPTFGLAVAEGLEAGLAVRRVFRPAWALYSAGALGAFPVLSGIDVLVIYPDADGVGLRAADACASRWHAAGAEVMIRRPRGGDVDEVLR